MSIEHGIRNNIKKKMEEEKTGNKKTHLKIVILLHAKFTSQKK